MNPVESWTHADSISVAAIFAAILVGIAVVFATIRGPIVAARQSDERKAAADKRAAKMYVFRQLMGHRYSVAHANWVGALNLVQVEFHDRPEVMKAFVEYIEAFHARHSDRQDCVQFRSKAIIRLVTAIGDELGYALDNLELLEQTYSPQAWADEAEQQRIVRQLFADIANGKRPLPVLSMVPDVFVEHLGEGTCAIRMRQVK